MDGVAAGALWSVLYRVQQAAARSGRSSDRIRVVAVCKTKPVSLIRKLYNSGHRCFGENYVQEIIEKAPQLPEDIKWHFMGNLQSNKVKPLLTSVPNLAMVETVDDKKIANQLNRMVANIERNLLKVFVQVNASGEESKSGVDPSGCMELVKYASLANPNLEFCGLTTTGMPDYTSIPKEPDVIHAVYNMDVDHDPFLRLETIPRISKAEYLLAIPLFEPYDNVQRYGPVISTISQ